MKTNTKTSKSGVLKEVKRFGSDFGNDLVEQGKGALGGALNDFASQLFGNGGGYDSKPQRPSQSPDPFNAFRGNPESFGPMSFGKQEKKEPKRPRKIEVVFNRFEMQQERAIMQQLNELMKTVRQELDLLKKQEAGLIQDIGKLAVEELPQKTGIYHLRFLEFIIKVLRIIRKKVSEGISWMHTGNEKKNARKHRGLAKKLGTQFSMSKELTQSTSPG